MRLAKSIIQKVKLQFYSRKINSKIANISSFNFLSKTDRKEVVVMDSEYFSQFSNLIFIKNDSEYEGLSTASFECSENKIHFKGRIDFIDRTLMVFDPFVSLFFPVNL